MATMEELAQQKYAGTILPTYEKLIQPGVTPSGAQLAPGFTPQQQQALMVPPQVEQEETKQPKHPVVPSKQPKPEEPSSVPTSPPPKERKIAGLPLSPKTFRQAIILSEILKPAKSVQK